jgi:hypothetical protein
MYTLYNHLKPSTFSVVNVVKNFVSYEYCIGLLRLCLFGTLLYSLAQK